MRWEKSVAEIEANSRVKQRNHLIEIYVGSLGRSANDVVQLSGTFIPEVSLCVGTGVIANKLPLTWFFLSRFGSGILRYYPHGKWRYQSHESN